MKKFILFFCTFLSVVFLSNAQTGPAGVGNNTGSSELRVWLKANEGIIFNSDDSVSVWEDQSGYNHHANVFGTATFPVLISDGYNGFPTLNFTGNTDQRLEIVDATSLDQSGDYTLFTVINPRQGADAEPYIISKFENFSFTHYHLGLENDNQLFSLHGSPGGALRSTATTALDTSGTGYYLVNTEVSFDGVDSDINFYLNGNLDNTGSLAGINANNSRSLFIGGGQRGSVVRRYAGKMAEVIIYNRTLNLVERILVENYLEAKYGGTDTANLFDIPNDKYAQPADSTYATSVVGIGRENSTNHTQSFGDGLRIRNRDFLQDDGDYVMFGYESLTNEIVTTDLPENTSERWSRDWFIDIRDVGTANGRVDMIFDFSEGGIAATPTDEYVLLYRAIPSGDYEIITASTSINSDQVTFVMDVGDLNSTGYYTLGKYQRQAGSAKGYTLNGTSSINTNYTTTLPSKLSVSAWFRLDNLSTVQAIIGKGNSDADEELALLINTNGSIRFDVDNSGQTSVPGLINAGEWYHIFATKDGGALNCWINGVLVTWQTANSVAATTTNLSVTIGSARNNTIGFSGQLDEVILWGTLVSETGKTVEEIVREWMCKTVDSDHPNSNNLLFYYRFDELVNTIPLDFSRNNNQPTLINTPAFVDSGAAIGDESVSNYGSLDTTLTGLNGEVIQVNNLTGTPDGFHIYRVDRSPNTVTTDLNALDSTQYWGVFVTGGTSPTYDFTYNFVGNPLAGDENQNRLAERDDNTIASWTNTATSPDKQNNTVAFNDNIRGEYILGFDGTASAGSGPGSFQSVQLDGADDFIDLGSGMSFGTADFSFEVWFKVDDFAGSANQVLVSKGISTLGTPANAGFSVLLVDDMANTTFDVRFQIRDASNPLVEATTTDLEEGEWYHLAGRRTGTEITLYINGILVDTQNSGVTYDVDSNVPLGLGAFLEPSSVSNFFKGKIDEFRLWTALVSPTNIQNWMCKKLNPSHPDYTDLISYNRFDLSSGTNSPDRAGVFNATLSTEAGDVPVFDFSGAPLGDEVVVDFGSPTSLQLSSSRSTFDINVTASFPQGVIIYQNAEAPQGTTLPADIFFLDPEYYGVFATGPITYTATYDYSSNDFFLIESELRLLYRENGESATWTDDEGMPNYTQDEGANTFTITGLTGTELALSGEDGALPITLLSFDAEVFEADAIKLDWVTVNETNNQFFDIERSTDGLRFTRIGRLDGAGNSNSILSYDFIDRNPVVGLNYYRLRQVDFDGRFSFSPIEVIYWNGGGDLAIKTYPNPGTDQITLELPQSLSENTPLRVYNQLGKLIDYQVVNSSETQAQIDVHHWAAGIYFLEFFFEGKLHRLKVIKI